MDIRNLYKAKSARNGEWCIGSLLQRKDEYYICPISGIYTVEFSNKEDAIKCEEEHFGVVHVTDYRIHVHCKYPHKLEIKFSDGTKHWYRQ